MDLNQILIVAIIVITGILFVWGRWRHDVVAFIGLTVAVVLNLISPEEAFLGFGHPATITVALVLIVSSTLSKSGSLEHFSNFICSISKHRYLHVSVLSLLAAVLSMFMNNIGALAILMPIAMESSKKFNRSPSIVLMPISFASILGGLVTLIGTPPNIIISSYREKVIGESYSLFDFSAVGGSIALGGVIFITIIGWKLIPVNKSTSDKDDGLFEIESYLSEVKIDKDSKLIEKSLEDIEKEISDLYVVIVSLIRKKQRYYIPIKTEEFFAGDILMLEGSHDDIDKFVTKYSVKIVTTGRATRDILHSKDTDTLEVVVSPNSRLEGRTIEQVRFKGNYNVNLLAISRESHTYRGRIKSQRIGVGDVLLLHGESEVLSDMISSIGCLPLAGRGLAFGRRKNALKALGIFVCAILSTILGFAPIYVSLGGAAVLMVILNILPIRELYEDIDWSIITLLAAMLPIGAALESTGTTALLVANFLSLSDTIHPVVMLTCVLVVTMMLSDVINNASTAIVMAPIANSIAIQTNLNQDSFLMAVAIGASCAFLTPIGHQNNSLIMSPGGYAFTDYWQLGLPLEILIVCISIPMILIVWPL